MSSTTAANSPGPSRKQILLLSVMVQVGLLGVLWFGSSLFRSSMQLDLAAMEERAEEVQKNNRHRVEEERKRREKVAIKEEDAEKLRQKARREQKAKVAARIREMREARDEVRKQRDVSLDKLKNRSFDQLNASKMEELLLIADRIADHSFHLDARTKTEFERETRAASLALRTYTEDFLEEMNSFTARFSGIML